MLAYIFIIAAFAFWIHAERKLSLRWRVGGGIAFWGSCLFILHYAHSVISNYERTYVARALKSVAADASSESRNEYLKLAEDYEKRRLSGAHLMLESEKVIRQLNVKEGEQEAGTGQPATRSQSKSQGGDKPQSEAELRSR
jgi:hypothetical protein